MKKFNLPPGLVHFYKTVDSYRQGLGLSYDQLLWAVFALLVSIGLFSTAWSQLTLFSGAVLLVLLTVVAYLAWNWQALQIGIAVVCLSFSLLLFVAEPASYQQPLGMLSMLLLSGGLIALLMLETSKLRINMQHVSLVYWFSLISCVLLLLLRWRLMPSVGLHYAGLPLANFDDSVLLMLVAMLFMFILFLRRHVQGGFNFLIAIPMTGTGVYVLLRIISSTSAQPELPTAVLEHSLLLLHVPLMLLGFVLLIMVCGMALLRLAGELEWFRNRQNKDVIETIHMSLDDNLFKQVKLAIILLAAGILVGMFWASLAWGHYWQWTFKPLMSMALWLYYLAGLHFRLQKNMQGRQFAFICLLGLPLLLMTLFGTIYWPDSLHNFDHS